VRRAKLFLGICEEDIVGPVVSGGYYSAKPKWRTTLGMITLVVISIATLVYVLVPKPAPRILGYTQISRSGRLRLPNVLGTLATDGQRLYFEEMDNDRFVVSEVSVSGGESAVVATNFPSTYFGDVAPDGSSMLVSNFEDTTSKAGEPVWLLPLPAGPPRQLGIVAHSITWSPDQKHLIYSNGPDLYEANADGTAAKKLLSVGSQFSDLRISPDGRKIRGTLLDLSTGFNTIWELNRDGSNFHAISRCRCRA